jgi:hypothetical protein
LVRRSQFGNPPSYGFSFHTLDFVHQDPDPYDVAPNKLYAPAGGG